MIENNTVVEDTATDTNKDTVDTKTNGKSFECVHCGVTKTKGKDNFRQAGSKYNPVTKDYDIYEKFIYWSTCIPCVDNFAKGKTVVS